MQITVTINSAPCFVEDVSNKFYTDRLLDLRKFLIEKK